MFFVTCYWIFLFSTAFLIFSQFIYIWQLIFANWFWEYTIEIDSFQTILFLYKFAISVEWETLVILLSQFQICSHLGLDHVNQK